ncbi:MAG: TIGR01212 family radical SAM protein [Clostridia bacterium]|nr:TIGR01212 family radical SAM protein [Clostridia bacterium]
MTQAERNPFRYSDTNKRYYTYDYYLRRRYGGKVAKIPLDAGMSCPNLDGRCGIGGCIYCSGRGSGDFAASPLLSFAEQDAIVREKLSRKWPVDRCIPYLQAHTNTDAPVEVLRRRYEEALALPGAVGLNIATRADCLPDDVVALLAEFSARTDLTVELGLQSVHDVTARRINRGHSWAQFVDGYTRLRAADPRIMICVHLIFGLPGEDADMMRESVKRLAALRPDGVKLHLLHVLRGTVLGDDYLAGRYTPMERDDYIGIVCDALELLPPETVICRLTGDGMADDLLAPDWSRRKVSVINDIDKEMYARGSVQGCRFSGD